MERRGNLNAERRTGRVSKISKLEAALILSARLRTAPDVTRAWPNVSRSYFTNCASSRLPFAFYRKEHITATLLLSTLQAVSGTLFLGRVLPLFHVEEFQEATPFFLTILVTFYTVNNSCFRVTNSLVSLSRFILLYYLLLRCQARGPIFSTVLLYLFIRANRLPELLFVASLAKYTFHVSILAASRISPLSVL